ncbi:hypothetical protein N781_09000 [Pontibacillus halophilus JSM 076056 = DSM 19796]|uniref:histidine kinase n=1 Tax=Pontibacillus halophilus JSM 076056 = DSM 19796 TaxID=1385510 RepID=A0A0A5GFE5_9BACI|nr:ATP-binding protein [Pontibacillus halophilus]KGX89845.1 hypothetical protein N781_09000 [Pontibacillus halophilus JSM 076056 = DSM 19796]
MDDRYIVTKVQPDGMGSAIGIEPYDSILTVDSENAANHHTIEQGILEQATNLTFKHWDEDIVEHVSLEESSFLSKYKYSLLLSFISLLYILSGILIYWKQPNGKASRMGIYINLCIGAIILSAYASSIGNLKASFIMLSLLNVVPLLLLLLITYLPHLNAINMVSKRVLLFITIVCSPLPIAYWITTHTLFANLILSGFVVNTIICIIHLIQPLFTLRKGQYRNLFSILFVAFVISFAPVITFHLVPFLNEGEALITFEYLLIPSILFPASISYVSVTKYPIDLSLHLPKLLIFSMTVAGILFLYWGSHQLLMLYNTNPIELITRIPGTVNIFLFTSLTLLLYISLNRLNHSLVSRKQNPTLFYRKRVFTEIETNQRIDRVMDHALHTISEILCHVEGASILLRGDLPRIKSTGNHKGNEEALKSSFLSTNTQHKDGSLVQICIPIEGDELIGWMLIGEKVNKSRFERQEVGHLNDFAQFLGEAFEVKQLLEDYQEYVHGYMQQITPLYSTNPKRAKQQIEIAEKERKKLSTFLHDHVLQDVLAVHHNLDTFSSNNEAFLMKHIKEFSTLHQTLEKLTYTIRDKSYDLYPAVLDDFGLLEAFNHLIHYEFVNSTPTIELNNSLEEGNLAELDRITLITLYRSVKELITNAIKHAQATEITIDSSMAENNLYFTVIDNGIGMHEDLPIEEYVKDNHIGLASVKHDIESLNGQLLIAGSRNSGCEMTIKLKLEETDESANHTHVS